MNKINEPITIVNNNNEIDNKIDNKIKDDSPPLSSSPSPSPTTTTSSNINNNKQQPSEILSDVSDDNSSNSNNSSNNEKKLIKIKKRKDKEQMDTIVKLFSSSFTSWMAVSYLYKYRDNPGIVDFLCNKLYSLEDKDIDFYITQLCILLINQPHDQKASFSSLARFVLDRCAVSFRFAIKAYWIFQAFEEDGEKNLFSIESSVYLHSPSTSPKDVPMYSNDQIVPIDLDKIYNQSQYDEDDFEFDEIDNTKLNVNNNNNNNNNNNSNTNTYNNIDNDKKEIKSNNNSNNESTSNGEDHNDDTDIKQQQQKQPNNNNNIDTIPIVNNTTTTDDHKTEELQNKTATTIKVTSPTSTTTTTTTTTTTQPISYGHLNGSLSALDGIGQPYIFQPNDPIENITQILKRNRTIYKKVEEKKELATRLREFCEMSVITCSRPLITRPRTSSLPSPLINFNSNNNNKSSILQQPQPQIVIDSSLISDQDDNCTPSNNVNDGNSVNSGCDSNGGDDEISILEKCKTPPVESKLSDHDFEFELSKSHRCDYLNDILSFVQKLAHISKILLPIPIDLRQAKLKHEISLLNINLPLGLYIPLWQSSLHHCVVRIPPEEVKILNSRERVPFLLVLEIIENENHEALSSNIFEVVSSYLQYTTTNKNNMKQDDIKRKYYSEKFKKSFLNTSISSSQTILNSDSSSSVVSSNTASSANNTTNTTSKSLPVTPTQSNLITTLTTGNNTTTTTANTTSSTSPLSSSPITTAATAASIVENLTKLTSPFGESWQEKTERYRKISPYGDYPNWRLFSVIVKTGDDCRQEQMAIQLISKFDEIWKQSKLPLYLRPYNILVTSSSGGIIETVPDTISLHNLKKGTPGFTTLLNHFKTLYGDVNGLKFRTAQSNFIESMAAYSIVTYILQIKDRHNGNILIDKEGHIVHIDFGFILTNSPGGISFETAPFKINQELVEVMGGVTSGQFQYFKVLCIRGLIEARKQVDKIISLIEIMMSGPKMSCFVGGKEVIEQLKARFFLDVNERECSTLVENLISYSIDHYKTRYYDKYQSWLNGIY